MNIGLKCDNMTYTAKYDTILYFCFMFCKLKSKALLILCSKIVLSLKYISDFYQCLDVKEVICPRVSEIISYVRY